MARVSAFIDGFNLYHALNNTHNSRFKWINLRKLIEAFVLKRDSLADVFYFTSLAAWNPDKVSRHELYIKALECAGVKTVYGKFRKVRKRCLSCKLYYVILSSWLCRYSRLLRAKGTPSHGTLPRRIWLGALGLVLRLKTYKNLVSPVKRCSE